MQLRIFILWGPSTVLKKRKFRRDEITVVPARAQLDWIEPGMCPSWVAQVLTEDDRAKLEPCSLP
jgi:hypothetical protein